jgi:hypothetical protein
MRMAVPAFAAVPVAVSVVQHRGTIIAAMPPTFPLPEPNGA